MLGGYERYELGNNFFCVLPNEKSSVTNVCMFLGMKLLSVART